MANTELTPAEIKSAQEADAIKAINATKKAFFYVHIRSEEYPAVVAKLREDILALARLHRNWNETTGEPDGMIDYFEEDIPAGALAPVIEREELSSIEGLTEDIMYGFSQASLLNPTIGSLGNVDLMFNAISDLITYHPEYNDRNGEIGL